MAVQPKLHRQIPRRFVQDCQVSRVGDEVQECLHGLGRRLVGGHAQRSEDLDPLATERLPIHAAKTGLRVWAATAATARAVAVASVMAKGVRITSTASTFLSLRTDFERARIAFRRGVAGKVDRVAVRPAVRQETVKVCEGFRRERCQTAAAGDQRVGGHDSRPAGVGDDGQSVGLRRQLAGQ